MKKLTRSDLIRLYNEFDHCKIINSGEIYTLEKLGYNAGNLGWNYSVFADYENNTLIISAYRNIPACIVEK